MPTMPIASPSTSEIAPRSFDEPSTAVTATNANSMIARYDGAPSVTANRDIAGANGDQQHRADGARHERTDGRGGQRLRGPARLGHLVALDRGDHRRRFTRRVQQDRASSTRRTYRRRRCPANMMNAALGLTL